MSATVGPLSVSAKIFSLLADFDEDKLHARRAKAQPAGYFALSLAGRDASRRSVRSAIFIAPKADLIYLLHVESCVAPDFAWRDSAMRLVSINISLTERGAGNSRSEFPALRSEPNAALVRLSEHNSK